jgi:DNA-binding response OmpR family regulator
MRFRLLHPQPADHTAFGGAGGHGPGAARRTPLLNLLLTSGGWREDAWAVAVPQILGAHGVNVIQARSGVEASNVIRSVTVHIAVVDLALPLDDRSSIGSEPAGARVLQLLRRLDAPPPVVVVRPPQPTRRESTRGLVDALLDGAFSVVDRPCHPETMLRVMQRIIERHYVERAVARRAAAATNTNHANPQHQQET